MGGFGEAFRRLLRTPSGSFISMYLHREATKKPPFPAASSVCIYIDPESRPALPGFARFYPAERRPGAGIQGIPPHVPMSQSATRPLGRPLAYQIKSRTLAGSHNIACKLHAITEDYHPPGRHQNRIFRVLQPFRAKTSIFMKKATFTSGAALVRRRGSLLLGVSRKHGNSRKSPLKAP